MLNPVAMEMFNSATYVDNYIDSVENLPDDVQRHLSQIRDIDVQYRSLLRDVDHYYDLWKSLQTSGDASSNRGARAIWRMQQSLIQAQELGDEKMQIVNQLQELIDHKTRQLDTDQKNLDIKEDLAPHQRAEQLLQADECGPTPPKQSRTQSPTRGSDQVTTSIGNGSSAGSGSVVHGERHSSNNGNIKEHSTNSFSGFGGSGGSSGGGGSTPNSDRSGAAPAGGNGTAANGGSATAGNVISSNVSNSDSQRSASKRSRRRNESATANSGGNLELGGNESNSANEAGASGSIGGVVSNERSANQKSTNLGSAAQKKIAAQNQSGSSAAAVLNNSTAGAQASGSGGSGSMAGGNNSGKKKKRKARGSGAQSSTAQANAREETPPPDPIDPDEPTYCVCNQISFGEMILCDNDLCPIEWFHFSCVSLVLKPKGKWFCPNCRGDRPNCMKPKAQFLKELERYNKEKEEKT